MNEVLAALRTQRGAWGLVAKRILESGVAQELPPKTPRRILLFGVGSSLVAAKLSAATITREWHRKRIHHHTQLLAFPSTDLGVSVFPEKGDWAFGFSHRGKTSVTLSALKACAEAGGFTVLVSAQGVPVDPSARLVLETCPLENCEPHTVGLTSAICAVTTLVLGTPIGEIWKSFSQAQDPENKKNPSAPPSVILGEWEGEWIAREISLKLIEIAGLQTRVYGTEEFFHGPHFLLQKGELKPEQIWVVSAPEDPRAPTLPQGAQVFEIKGSGPLSWVPTLVELQWLTLGFQEGSD